MNDLERGSMGLYLLTIVVITSIMEAIGAGFRLRWEASD